ncbi:MAG: helix-hairpin-helix domain-containing protein [Candidatus Levyibacteriota bacterium]
MEVVENLFTLLKKIPKQYYIPLFFGFFGLILFGYGLIQLINQNQPRENSSFEDISQASPSAIQSFTTITVDIEGAVVNPGVYKLATDARVQDGLIQAGGMSSFADRQWAAKNLNLAAKLTDGAKVYIPYVGEVATSSQDLSNNAVAGVQATGLININSATAEQLNSLPGIGSVTAQKIINARLYNGVGELLSRKIVTSKVYGQIQTLVTVN